MNLIKTGIEIEMVIISPQERDTGYLQSTVARDGGTITRKYWQTELVILFLPRII